ncbi:glucose 1-dehydrogenase [Actinomadura oligospora]|uniref:glucose 1-dehydrogenase n=1 Tax=Actinomadura oligospora TaxID=111804 RepID=UPI00047C1B52|nr:glucose 1-dehydrogenase [Actinomadura oligospora]
MTKRFTNKTALITGGTSGMGLATARLMLDEGAKVVITGRDQARLDAAAKELDAGDRLLAVRADAADLADLDVLAERIRARFGRLDVLFANAGVGLFQRSAEVTEDDFDQVVGTNFKGVYFTIQKVVPLMTGGGSVVVNASWTQYRGLAVASVYSASKAAVLNLARTLSSDLADRSIRVNSVSPGYIDTPMFRGSAPTDEEAAAYTAQVVTGRLGASEDVARAVAFLASDDASYITGQDLVVDGGLVSSLPA